MGQKVHPYGFRLGYIRTWKSRWFEPKKYVQLLHEDLRVRKFVHEAMKSAGISSVEITRSAGRMRVRVHAARPGLVIGRRGQEIDRLREDLSKFTTSEVFIDIQEVKVPQIDAQLVAENVAMQLEKRVSFRRALKRAMQLAMSKGAGGIKVQCKGRLGGSEIARQEGYKQGKVPLGTLRADVDYGFSQAFTTYGTIGVKVWIYKGDILVKQKKKEEEELRAASRMAREGEAPAPQTVSAALPSAGEGRSGASSSAT